MMQARGLAKRFGHVDALRGATLSVDPGEVIGLVGDNGAGKSTLLKVLSGWHRADRGEVVVDGTPIRLRRPADARRAGIETLYQDLALARDLDVVANLFLGREDVVGTWVGRRVGVLRHRAMRAEAERILADMDVRLPSLDVPVGALSGGQQQIIAVARTLAWARRIVLLDEPTAALGVRQTEQVRRLVRRAAERGVASVVISHNLPELLELVDRIVVMRLGRDVASIPVTEADPGALIRAMSGLAAA